MGNSLQSWRRATRCHIIWASNNKTATRRLSMGLSLQPRRRHSNHKSSECKNDASEVIHVHISMATTITFVIHLVMKGKSPPSNMCTTTNNIYYKLKCDNANIIMMMLTKRKCTSPNKPYFTPILNFMSTREDHETSTTKTELRLHQPLRHLRQVFSRHLCLLSVVTTPMGSQESLLWLRGAGS